MALKDEVLKNFFTKTSKPLKAQSSSIKNNFQKIPHHRVFDEPVQKENDQEIALKMETNRRQTGDKLETKPKTNQRQTRDKLETSVPIIRNHKTETRDTTRDTTRDKPETNWRQTGDKKLPISNFTGLVGLQREISLLLFMECKKFRTKVTPPLSVEYLSKGCKSNVFSTKKTLQRLEKKHMIKRTEWKEGRGGWTRYELAEHVYNEILHNELNSKLETNWRQTRDKLETQLETQLETSLSSSSSNYINTTTTELSDEWQKIDLSPLESIGLTFGHLIQLQRSGISSTEIVQDSINHFAYDLSHNNKAKEIKTNPIGYFMGIMRRAGIYTAPDNYESEADKALRVYMESKKLQQEKKAAMEVEIIELSYNEWILELTEDEKKSLLPDHALNSKLEGPKIAALKMYFKKNIWPNKKHEISQQAVD